MYRSALSLLTDLRRGRVGERHVGVLVPWANSVVETELPRFAGVDVVWHFARLVPAGRITALDERFLAELIEAVPGAQEQLGRLRLDGTLLGCTSAGFTGVSDPSAGGSEPIDAFSCLVRSLPLLSARRVVLLTPYPADISACEVHALEHESVEVVGHGCLDRSDDYAYVEPADVRALLAEVDDASLAASEAVVLSCTGWPTASLVGELERATGRPVLTSTLAMVLTALTAWV